MTTSPEVGQTIYASTGVGPHREIKPLLVTRVGRKWFYASPEGASSSAEQQFSLDTWTENSNFGWKAVALTVDEYAEHQARSAALERLHSTGYRIKGISHNRSQLFLTTEQLIAIAEIIEKGDTE
ncbi:hypothetical protein HWC43_gp57 [Corynebacterium phage Dina]|uniref:Uncharacterized protein n=1 Tax=Corynebacterium phage Dina TaxID=2588501 RepID=A0A4Y6ENR3_9CAUD|nr:hypothetical protein HWC43_gp57 [Corynebacterium phage Dina]QDF19677.1 hypothetical protein SEA_DINA_57 [Corynebacterium phage Dina]